MSCILALIGNRPNVCAAAAQKYTPELSLHREATLGVEPDGSSGHDTRGRDAQGSDAEEALAVPALGWGLGFYQAGQPLLRRRPVDERETVQISAFRDISSSAYLAQIRTPTVGALRTENTPPFRFGKWLFAMRGTVAGFESLRPALLEALPAALRANVRGQSDGEYVFHSFLHSLDTASGLARDSILPGDIGDALVRGIAKLDEVLEVEGFTRPIIDCIATNGEHLVALNRSGTMSYQWLQGAEELAAWLPPSLERTGTELFRCSVLTAGCSHRTDGWEQLVSNALLLCSRTEPPVVQVL